MYNLNKLMKIDFLKLNKNRNFGQKCKTKCEKIEINLCQKVQTWQIESLYQDADGTYRYHICPSNPPILKSNKRDWSLGVRLRPEVTSGDFSVDFW